MPSDHQQSAPRAIVYARYSSDHQRDASIEDQIRECRAFIERQGWVYQHAYVDRALSGASTVRPGYQLMLEGARERQFDIAVAEALDRFSRDQEDIAALYKRFRFAASRSSPCAAARNKGAAVCKNLKNVRRDRLEAAVLDALRDNLMDPELFKEFCAEYVREINRVRGDENARRDRLRSELTQVERRLRRIVEAIADGVPARTLKEELVALETRQDQLVAELAAAPEAQQPLLHPNLAEIYRQKVAALAEALADETMRDEAFELIRSLLDKIVLVPEGEELRIEIQGELGGILELCQQSRTPGRSRASAEQIKAGCGGRI